ncbi:hypothetical protein B0H16DRAFT_1732563 [Mycena metata]|uniref:Uncharacterized protein n=1 Tax=Mycena metata TaxID=1033252 RepID=A0AAD7MUR4_9AGAR|nr:hypothetical protein B0H16DRAFT_1732563 [Mycena metata]
MTERTKNEATHLDRLIIHRIHTLNPQPDPKQQQHRPCHGPFPRKTPVSSPITFSPLYRQLHTDNKLVQAVTSTLWNELPLLAIAEAHKKRAEDLVARGTTGDEPGHLREVNIDYAKYLLLYPGRNSEEYRKILERARLLERVILEIDPSSPTNYIIPEPPPSSQLRGFIASVGVWTSGITPRFLVSVGVWASSMATRFLACIGAWAPGFSTLSQRPRGFIASAGVWTSEIWLPVDATVSERAINRDQYERLTSRSWPLTQEDAHLSNKLAQDVTSTLWNELPLLAIAEAHKNRAENLVARGTTGDEPGHLREVYIDYAKYLLLYPGRNSEEYLKILERARLLKRVILEIDPSSPTNYTIPEPQPSSQLRGFIASVGVWTSSITQRTPFLASIRAWAPGFPTLLQRTWGFIASVGVWTSTIGTRLGAWVPSILARPIVPLGGASTRALSTNQDARLLGTGLQDVRSPNDDPLGPGGTPADAPDDGHKLAAPAGPDSHASLTPGGAPPATPEEAEIPSPAVVAVKELAPSRPDAPLDRGAPDVQAQMPFPPSLARPQALPSLPFNSWTVPAGMQDMAPSPPSITVPLSADWNPSSSMPSLPFESWSIRTDLPSVPPWPPSLTIPLAGAADFPDHG